MRDGVKKEEVVVEVVVLEEEEVPVSVAAYCGEAIVVEAVEVIIVCGWASLW